MCLASVTGCVYFAFWTHNKQADAWYLAAAMGTVNVQVGISACMSESLTTNGFERLDLQMPWLCNQGVSCREAMLGSSAQEVPAGSVWVPAGSVWVPTGSCMLRCYLDVHGWEWGAV